MKKIKILQMITVILFAFVILITVIGLYLIWFSDFHHFIHYKHHKNSKYSSGFSVLKHFGLSFILFHSPNSICSITNHPENYQAWVQLQTGIILCLIISPILLYITILFITFILIFKIKIKNNNFWDAIENFKIINNYYVH
ncbi:hypothetical protein [Spiroplasma ixodetis]|uniref:hypothetical protein n=1 Tax=Spiroplasma ixodetis TaxID=2141 RepID=UPI00257733A2|nr:hypothetical protein [Spiroplasma ixodetis]WJG70823.1 hypothetical protein SIXOD_v1c20820 [Spiroplasma ixodetis Y32]